MILANHENDESVKKLTCRYAYVEVGQAIQLLTIMLAHIIVRVQFFETHTVDRLYATSCASKYQIFNLILAWMM